MQAFGFLARKVGALFFEEIGALLDFLVGRADDEFFGFGYALFGGLGVGAALVFRLPFLGGGFSFAETCFARFQAAFYRR